MKKLLFLLSVLFLVSCGDPEILRLSDEVYVVSSATYVGKGRVKYTISTKATLTKPVGFGFGDKPEIWDTISVHDVFFIFDTVGALNPGDTLPFNRPKFVKKSVYKLPVVDTTKYVTKPVVKPTPKPVEVEKPKVETNKEDTL